jgi:hypothetical protein
LVKAVPLENWSGPEGSRKLRFPDLLKSSPVTSLEWPIGFQEVKVPRFIIKQSRYRPGVAQRVPGSYGSQIYYNAVPLQVWGRPEGSRKLRFRDLL